MIDNDKVAFKLMCTRKHGKSFVLLFIKRSTYSRSNFVFHFLLLVDFHNYWNLIQYSSLHFCLLRHHIDSIRVHLIAVSRNQQTDIFAKCRFWHVRCLLRHIQRRYGKKDFYLAVILMFAIKRREVHNYIHTTYKWKQHPTIRSSHWGLLHNVEPVIGFCKHFMSESLGRRYGLGGRLSSQ